MNQPLDTVDYLTRIRLLRHPGACSQACQAGISQIGDQHASGRMSDAVIGADLGDDRLRGDAAGPKHRQLAGSHWDGVAIIGLGQVLDADGLGRPICTGAPCTEGKREVIWIARIASPGLSGRMETTSGPANGPAGTHWILVRYIGTFEPQVI